MNNEERLNTFIRVFFQEIEFQTTRTGSEAIKCALVAFGADLGILDSNKEVRLDGEKLLFPNTVQSTCRVTDLFANYAYFGAARISTIMYNSEYTEVPRIYSSDKETLIRNLARVALKEDGLDKYLMHRSVCDMAKELRIITEVVWREILNMPLNRYDYYYNIKKLRFCIDLEEKSNSTPENN